MLVRCELWTFLLDKVLITEITHRTNRNMHTITHTAQKKHNETTSCSEISELWFPQLVLEPRRSSEVDSEVEQLDSALPRAMFHSTHASIQINYSCISSDYSGIILDAFMRLLCSKLCQHNRRIPNWLTST